MTDIQQQIEWLRRLYGNQQHVAADIADTMEKLLSVYEAADEYLNPTAKNGVTRIDDLLLRDALDNVQASHEST